MNNNPIEQVDFQKGFPIFLILSLIVLFIVFLQLPASLEDFRRFFGRIHPLVLYLILPMVGAAALWVLQSRFGLLIFRGRSTLQGMGWAAVLATLLGAAIITADYFLRYPENMNISYPRALLFYPAIGFAAEIIFHLLPLTLLLLALNPLAGHLGKEKVVWLAILLTAVSEPVFQVVFAGEALTGRNLYTLFHVFLIAFLQLYLFRRFDFLTMYSMRLFYYFYWHILWGVLRLDILF